jgi:Bacterial Ig-like domain (group 2)
MTAGVRLTNSRHLHAAVAQSHDEWFSVDDLAFDQLEGVLQMPLPRPVSRGGSWFAKKAPDADWRLSRLLRICAALAAAVAFASCAGSDGTGPFPESNAVAHIVVTPTSLEIEEGTTATLTVTLTNASGDTLTGRPIAFRSSNESVASVDATGKVTGIAPGDANITVSSEGQAEVASVLVTATPVALVSVTGAEAPLSVRSESQLVLTLLSQAGDTLADRHVDWTSTDTAIVRVNESGSVIAVGAGSAQVIATSGGVVGTASVTVMPGGLEVRGVYAKFTRRGYPNGYFAGDLIRDFEIEDPLVPGLGLVKEEVGRQLAAMSGLGVNTITFEIRSADSTVAEREFPTCNVSHPTGLLFPQPSAVAIQNLPSLFDLANSHGIQVFLRLVNTHMELASRADSETWLTSILTPIKDHPALQLVLFEGDVFHRDGDNDGVMDVCGSMWEPPLNTGPDQPVAQYVEWAIGLGRSIGIPVRKLSAQAVIGVHVVDMEFGAGSEFQDQRQWHPLGVMRAILDRMGVPEADRTYAVSHYQSNKCHVAGPGCVDLDPAAWAEETVLRAWSKIGFRSPARLIAVESGSVTPITAGWDSHLSLETAVSLWRRFGLRGGAHWLWAYTDDDHDANLTWPTPIRRRTGVGTQVEDVLRRLYGG